MCDRLTEGGGLVYEKPLVAHAKHEHEMKNMPKKKTPGRRLSGSSHKFHIKGVFLCARFLMLERHLRTHL